jgi:hypothetical protein
MSIPENHREGSYGLPDRLPRVALSCKTADKVGDVRRRDLIDAPAGMSVDAEAWYSVSFTGRSSGSFT